jgi:hydroxymethylbilane synthase
MQSFAKPILVAARNSPLSKVQVQEVEESLRGFYPEIQFSPIWLDTRGDRDQKTSLKTLPRDDFFTRELDEALFRGNVRAAIHSAKDLACPIPPGLAIVALTAGRDGRDALVLRKEDTLSALPKNARIATSSTRRDALIGALRADLQSVDIRGTIEKRLSELASRKVDGIIMAMCALERLRISDYTIIPLDGPHARFQGRLAVLARDDDTEMCELFSPLDTKKTLYFGLRQKQQKGIRCQPLIEIVPLPCSLRALASSSHILVTSRTSLDLLRPFLETTSLQKEIISIGRKTSALAREIGFKTIHTARTETSEGVIELLGRLKLQDAKIFWPHSSLSRRTIPSYLEGANISFSECELYTTRTKRHVEKCALDQFDELFFSSPSTVDAFFELYGLPPDDILIRTQGAITYNYLKEKNSLL